MPSERVDYQVRALIKEGLANMGTDEETVLFSSYVAGEISLNELYIELVPTAIEIVNEMESNELIYAK